MGYAQSSIAEIARRAGVSKGVVSYHFAGKEELLTAVVADLYQQPGAQIAARVQVPDEAVACSTRNPTPGAQDGATEELPPTASMLSLPAGGDLPRCPRRLGRGVDRRLTAPLGA